MQRRVTPASLPTVQSLRRKGAGRSAPQVKLRERRQRAGAETVIISAPQHTGESCEAEGRRGSSPSFVLELDF